MSLDYNYESVDLTKYPKYDDKEHTIEVTDADTPGYMNPITEAFIWHTLGCEMGSPSKDPDEWVFRVTFYEKLMGPSVFDWDNETQTRTPHHMSVEEIMDHVGITTNVINKSRAQFLKKCAEMVERYDVSYSLKKYKESLEEVSA